MSRRINEQPKLISTNLFPNLSPTIIVIIIIIIILIIIIIIIILIIMIISNPKPHTPHPTPHIPHPTSHTLNLPLSATLIPIPSVTLQFCHKWEGSI